MEKCSEPVSRDTSSPPGEHVQDAYYEQAELSQWSMSFLISWSQVPLNYKRTPGCLISKNPFMTHSAHLILLLCGLI